MPENTTADHNNLPDKRALLRGVARRIPQHWQTRVKNWLRA